MPVRVFALCLSILLVMSCRQPAAEEALVEAGVSRALARQRAERIRELRYDLRFDIPAGKDEPIRGQARISFELADAGQPLLLDFRVPERQLLAVRCEADSVSWRFENEHIIIPPAGLREGENRLDLDFIAGDLSLNRSEDYLYTLFVPDRAATAFPCFDQPDLKARFRLALELPAGWQALANGALADSSATDGRVQLRFAETRPISTYLFAFAAGRFQRLEGERDGRRMQMLLRETDAEKVAANANDIFDLHAAALAWLEAYTGIPYPFGKFDFVLLPGFQYGGMEHPGCIFYREPSLLLDPDAGAPQLLSRARLIAHETAHMWFGDLVTMRWFDDVWLKEVFANFMAAKIVTPNFPDLNHRLSFLLAHQPAAYSEDRSEGSHPIRQQLENLKDAGTLYGRIIYQKAPVVMRQLERRIGEEAFQAGLQQYLQQYAYGNASWDDLIAILDAQRPEALADWSQVWVKEAGMPQVRTEMTLDEGRIRALRLIQEQRSGGGNWWPQYTELLLFFPDSIRVLAVQIEGEETEVPAAAGLPAPAAVLAHGSELSYGYFRLAPAGRRYLLTQLPAVEAPLWRGAGWLTLYEACLRQELAPDSLLAALIQALPREDEPLNRSALLGYMRSLYWRFLSPSQRQAVAPELESQLWQLALEASDAQRCRAYFEAYQAVVLSEAGTDRLYRLWQGESLLPKLRLSESDRIDLSAELALRLPDRAAEILDAGIARVENPDRRQRLAFIRPALAAEQEVRDTFFASLAEAENRHYEPWVVDALGYLHHPLRARQAEAYIYPSLQLLEEIQRTGDIFFPRQWITATLSGHQRPEAAAIVRQFLAVRPDYPYRLKNKILMAADLLFRAAAWQERAGS